MGFDGKYGRVTTEHGDIPDDEPVVVFRARDVHLPEVLRQYGRLCWESGSPTRHTDITRETTQAVVAWQQANKDLVREPGSERSRQWMGDSLYLK